MSKSTAEGVASASAAAVVVRAAILDQEGNGAALPSQTGRATFLICVKDRLVVSAHLKFAGSARRAFEKLGGGHAKPG